MSFKKITASLGILILSPSLALGAQGDFFPNNQSSLRTNGITMSSHTQGTQGSVQFNLFRDNNFLSNIRGRNYVTGPYSDERDFVTARRLTESAHSHSLSNLQVGEKIRVSTYVHNNAAQVCGGGNTARNTNVRLNWNNPTQIVSSVSASNANPSTINDIVSVSFAGDYTFEYANTATIARFVDGDYVCTGGSNNMVADNTNPTISGDTASVNLGNIDGSFGNFRVVSVDLVVVATPEPPSINIDKDDNQPNGSDPDGADSQTVDFDGTAAFNITVTNDGPVALRNVVVSDPVTPACGRTAAQTQALYSGSTFAPGDSFSYVCNATNVQANFTNTARVDAVSAVDGITNVNDSDPTEVRVNTPVPDIQIEKDDSTPGTPDSDGDDSQTVDPGGTAIFDIRVFNDGQVSLENVVITDPRSTSCARSAAQTLALYAGNTFDPGEEFSYQCEATNVTDAFINLANVSGDPVDGQDTVVDSDTTEVLLMAVPSIDIDKDDSTPGSADIDGDDHQKVFSGDTATFTITVTNDGPVALNTVIVNDPLAPNCDRSAAQTEALYAGNTFDPGESFQYQCTKPNTTVGFTNEADVSGLSVVDGTQVVDADTTTVEVPPIRVEIDIDKDDSTPGTADTDGNDNQIVEVGDDATFTITVTNLGNDNLRDIVITDPNAPACDRNAAQTRALIRQVGNGDDVLNAAPNIESFTYTCVDTGVTGPYVNTANVVGVGVTRGDTTTDSDPTTVDTTTPENPKIQILKWDEDGLTDSDGADVQTIDRNGTANFTIQVTNTGNVGLERVSTGDELAPNCALTVQDALVYIRAIGDQDAVFDPGETFTYTCTDTNVADSYTNTVTVRGFSISSGAKVEDDDPTDVIVRDPQPTCSASSFDVDTVAPNGEVTYSWTATDLPINAQLVCSGAGLDIREDVSGRTSRTLLIPETATDGEVLTCRIEMPDGTELCRDTVTVQTADPEAEITIDKDDQDNTDDTQKINRNGTAKFTITVTNTGEVDLTEVFVDDNRAENCVRTDVETAVLIQAIGNNDAIFNVDESFSYECEQDQWNLSTNEAITRATPTNGDPVVTDEDSTRITFNGGGGGTPDTHPSIGVCSVAGNGAPQCQGQRPVENPSDPAWVDYYACTQGNGINPARSPEECVRDVWAPAKGLDGKLCGFNNDYFDYKNMTSDEQRVACTPILPPLPPSCTPVDPVCPECFKQGDVTIEKKVRTLTGSLGESADVAKGERVEYEIRLDGLEIDQNNFQLTSLEVRVHDRLIPAESGWQWGRGSGALIDGDDVATWEWNPTNEYFTRKFIYNSPVMKDLNDHGRLVSQAAKDQLFIPYGVYTDLVTDRDEADLNNVAFATIVYTYNQLDPLTRNWDPVGGIRTIGVDDACDAAAAADLYELYQSRKAAGASFGDDASLTIIRPFVEARGGNIAIRTNDKIIGETGNISGAHANQGVIVENSDNDIFGGFDFDTTDIEDVADDFRSDRDDYYENLEANMQTGATLPSGLTAVSGAEVMTHNYDSGIYVIKGGEVKVTGTINLSRASTFILQGASLVIEQNVEFDDYFGAFVVREGNGFTGDIAIANHVTEMSGVYIAEGESRIVALGSTPDTTHKLQVNGNLIGDLSHLLSFRKYIGTTAGAPEPSLIVAFDLRILESTPPILEQFLGQDWKETVSQ